MLGAAFAAAAPGVPSWEAGFDGGNNVGGLLQAVLKPSGGFGKFLTVLVALSIPSACAPTMYTFASSLMTIHVWFARVPRYVYTIISEAMYVFLCDLAEYFSLITVVVQPNTRSDRRCYTLLRHVCRCAQYVSPINSALTVYSR